MRRFFSIVMFVMLCLKMTAQQQAASPQNDALAREMTEKLVKKYTFTAQQANEVYTIEARKLRNLAQIETIKTENPALYRAKLESVHRGTLSSIKRILATKEQKDLFSKTQSETRSAKAIKKKELMSKSATKEVIEDALLDIYAE